MRFQLINPAVGQKIYQTDSLEKGAKKCYGELKQFAGNNHIGFSIMNVDTFEVYKYEIDANYNKQKGGDTLVAQKNIGLDKETPVKSREIPQPIPIPKTNVNELDNIKQKLLMIEDKLKLFDERLSRIETPGYKSINSIYRENLDKLSNVKKFDTSPR